MAHFAQLNLNNIVTDVIVVNNDVLLQLPFPESEAHGIAFLKAIYGQDTIWKQTSYNNNFRHKYAGIGDVYDEANDVFISPRPYPSWSLNTQLFKWEPPTPYPNVIDDSTKYKWNEDTLQWETE